MVLLDALGRRWSLRILWELRGDALRFRALRAACDDASPTVLNDRLSLLRELKLVDLSDRGYELTSHGRELGRTLAQLDVWAESWAEALDDPSEK